MTTQNETKTESPSKHREALLYPSENRSETVAQIGLFCPNCGGRLEGRKCKLLCLRAGCGYMVTCSEW